MLLINIKGKAWKEIMKDETETVNNLIFKSRKIKLASNFNKMLTNLLNLQIFLTNY